MLVKTGNEVKRISGGKKQIVAFLRILRNCTRLSRPETRTTAFSSCAGICDNINIIMTQSNVCVAYLNLNYKTRLQE